MTYEEWCGTENAIDAAWRQTKSLTRDMSRRRPPEAVDLDHLKTMRMNAQLAYGALERLAAVLDALIAEEEKDACEK